MLAARADLDSQACPCDSGSFRARGPERQLTELALRDLAANQLLELLAARLDSVLESKKSLLAGKSRDLPWRYPAMRPFLAALMLVLFLATAVRANVGPGGAIWSVGHSAGRFTSARRASSLPP